MADEQQDLRELLANAQTALEEGRHQEATVACRHVLRDYPESVTAMRLLGESYLEAGRADEAGRAFEKVLAIDPYNVLARVGLGVLAEDRGEDERAIAQFRQAWEVAPTLPQLRSELVRLYRKRYGVGGRLRMTRLALANLHAQNDDLPRAIRQFQQLFDEDPARPEIGIGLAESLWRHGDRDEAAGRCRALLGDSPRLVRPALILAAIQGDGDESAPELLAAARGFDPDAVIARDLLVLQSSPTLTRFIDEPVAMTPFDPATLDIAGTDELLGSQTSTLGEESFRWEDIADGLTGESALRPDAAVDAADTGEQDADDVDALFAAIDRQLSTVDIDDELPVFTMPDEDSLAEQVSAVDAPQDDWATEPDDAMAPAPDEPTAVERLTANWDNIDNELAAARPSDDPPAVVTGMLGDVDGDLMPFDVESDSEPEAEQTITFDPAKFSLPPLDGEDDDDYDAVLEADDLGADIAPFTLDEVGSKTRASGLSFSELVRKESQGELTAPLPEGQFTDILGENADLGGMTSIFATRELAPLPEDRVLDTQALPIDSPTPSPPPTDEPQSLDATALLATIPLAAQASADADTAPPVDTAASGVTLVADEAADEDQPKQPRTFAELFDQHSARRDGADTDQPDATRPLLALDDLDVPEGPAEAEARQLFERLRNSKPERVDTGELQPAPEQEPLAFSVPEDVSDDRVAKPEADHGDVDLFESVSMDSPALDDWMMSLVQSDAEERGAGEPLTARDGDDWLIEYPLAAEDSVDDYQPLTAAQSIFDHDAPQTPWELDPVVEHAPVVDGPQSTSWSGLIPDEPLPAVGRFAADEVWRDESVPSWATELPADPPAISEPYMAAVAQPAPAARTNGTYPAAGSVVPAAPVRVEPERPTVTAQDLDEQRAILESLVQSDPGNPFARLTLAVAYSGTDPERALNEYRRLIKDADELVPEIIERLKEMIADGDAPARAHRILGDAYMKLGQFDLAMTEFQRALAARTRARK